MIKNQFADFPPNDSVQQLRWFLRIISVGIPTYVGMKTSF